MKMMKWALLGGAAVAVMSTSAQADELTALKAQLESLQSRVTQLEAQPATSMPSGYSLLSIRDGSQEAVVAQRQMDRTDPNSGFTLSVLPAADVAPAAEVSVSGEIRTLLIYKEDDSDNPDGDNELDVQVRGRLVVQGKVDTAVGEVGARIRLQGGDPFDSGSNNNTKMNQAYGWWKFAPTWQLIAGYWDTTAAVQAGVDWDFTLGPTGGPSDKNVEQMRLVYGGDGPFSLAIAVEDTDGSVIVGNNVITTDGGGTTVLNHFLTTTAVDRGLWPAIAGYIMYNNDKLMFQAVGVVQDDQSHYDIIRGDRVIKAGGDTDWGIGGGARIGLGDMFTLTAAGVYAQGYNGWANDFTIANDDAFWAASVGVIFNVAEATRLEVGGGYEQRNVDVATRTYDDENVWTAQAGIYWDPVSQVTVGLQGAWQDFSFDAKDEGKPGGPDDTSNFSARFGTWLRFP
jgi:hypothetical protein